MYNTTHLSKLWIIHISKKGFKYSEGLRHLMGKRSRRAKRIATQYTHQSYHFWKMHDLEDLENGNQKPSWFQNAWIINLHWLEKWTVAALFYQTSFILPLLFSNIWIHRESTSYTKKKRKTLFFVQESNLTSSQNILQKCHFYQRIWERLCFNYGISFFGQWQKCFFFTFVWPQLFFNKKYASSLQESQYSFLQC